MGKHLQPGPQQRRRSASPQQLLKSHDVNKQMIIDSTSTHIAASTTNAVAPISPYAHINTSVAPLNNSIIPFSFTSTSSPSPPSLTQRLIAARDLATSVAVPVSTAAVQVFHTWCSVVSTSITKARKLQKDWNATMNARREMRVMKEKYTREKVAAKEREKMAMERLAQLEEQLRAMQQLVATQPPSSPTAAVAPPTPAVATSLRASFTPFRPPVAAASSSSPASSTSSQQIHLITITPPTPPPMVAANVPIAPPMTSVVSASSSSSSATTQQQPQQQTNYKPNSVGLLVAAGQLRPIADDESMIEESSSTQQQQQQQHSSIIPSQPSTFTSSLISTNMLQSVKLKSVVVPPSSSVRAQPTRGRRTSHTGFLIDALQLRFGRHANLVMQQQREQQQSTAARYALPSRPSFAGLQVAATPASSMAMKYRQSSAFSPMTPCDESDWTPAH